MPNGAQSRGSSTADPDLADVQTFADALRDQTHCYVEKRRADAARLVSDVGEAIRDTGTNFDGLPQLKEFFDQAALGVDGFAEDISRRSFGEMYDEVHAAVRRRPALATAAAVLAGFALFRVLRTPDIRPVPRSRAVVPVDVFPTPNL
ncbi:MULTISPECIES: hypothetical protein [Methylobacterium]|jgi:hypothetical protein|uniref:DUF3618 domain-containing protein n=1 Tax=Methylobacterium longum TaxID=767694 RepID=A0ABT8AJH4_9HYPH|nr:MULTISPECIES: hypothetical protein [Methylobacterium]MCJ2097646.1 hypothetical protein [Methylobacterium sp. E-046]MDN3569961.1 hypothetical protein [Methylobacterium longum]GJE14534.1 hypothetical protein FOHLNKBM_5609 [Methylobacterium longum]